RMTKTRTSGGQTLTVSDTYNNNDQLTTEAGSGSSTYSTSYGYDAIGSQPQFHPSARLPLRLERRNVRELPLVFHAHDLKAERLQALGECVSVVETLRRLDDVELTVELRRAMRFAQVIGEIRAHEGEREDRHVERLVVERHVGHVAGDHVVMDGFRGLGLA